MPEQLNWRKATEEEISKGLDSKENPGMILVSETNAEPTMPDGAAVK